MEALLISVIKIGAVTIVLTRLLKSAGKTEFANIIALGGWCSIGVSVAGYLHKLQADTPQSVKSIASVLGDFIKWVYANNQ